MTQRPMEALTVSEALTRLAADKTDYKRLIEEITYDIGLYKPHRIDLQTAHSRDELYIVAAGTGEFVCDRQTKAFGPGDMFFVPGGAEHHFLDFSKDFSTWVVFFGTRPSK